MRFNSITLCVVVGLVVVIFTPRNTLAENFERGKELYANQCEVCHDKPIALNKSRKITTLSALRERISSWATHTGSGWGSSEIDDVSYFLNKIFYHFPDKEL